MVLPLPAAPELRATFVIDGALDLRLILGPLWRGSGDPTMRFEPSGTVWRALHTPAGPATLRLSAGNGTVLAAEAWGAGATDALALVPDLVGLTDQPECQQPRDPIVAGLVHRFPGLRLTRTNRLFDALLPAILEQKVTNTEAWRGYRGVVHTVSQPAPGPMRLWLPPRAADVAALPYFALHRFGVERRRAELVRRVAGMAERLEAAMPAEAAARLLAVPGIGPWTVAEVTRLTYGDPDAVSVGDYHLPSLVAWIFAGERRGDDARMLELLEPYRGQRGRVVRLLEVSGRRPPRRGPRLAPRRFEDM